ncbi:MAG: cell division protein FtsA [Oenococcus sp.]|uniref:cell division protein FtsA n=1 Tax=Oenococcus TaxID=46254 RepID=UPI0021E8AD9C|nr:cell division protein FtsA [Oenococcus kitaharae]MCV3295931.1 cell division protein FtsA [Oenococcus kitaharae]
MNNDVIVGLDVGSDKIKCVIIKRTPNQHYGIVAVGETASQGVKHGMVVDIAAASRSIADAIAQAESKANFSITEVSLSLPAIQISMRHLHGSVNVARNDKRITEDDVVNAFRQAVSTAQLPANQEVVDLIPEEFVIDGFGQVPNPLDMVGVVLEVNAQAFIGPKTIVENLKTAVRQAGLIVSELILSPISESELILSENEQSEGSIIIDLGAFQTTASIVKNHRLQFIANIQQGGAYVTSDIRTVLAEENHISISFDQAEQIKRDFGYADPLRLESGRKIELNRAGSGQVQEVAVSYLSQIIGARLEEISSELYAHLNQLQSLPVPRSMVLTGGGAALAGIDELFNKRFNKQVHVFVPQEIGLRHPSFVNSLSVANYVANQSVTDWLAKRTLNLALVSPSSDFTQASPEGEQQKARKRNRTGSDEKKPGFLDKIKEYYSRMFE